MNPRAKTFDATGVAPGGRLYAGDLNLIQDLVAALTDLTQNLTVGSLAVGESGLTISRFGAAEAALAGALRISGILRPLVGFIPPQMTTTARNALAVGAAPFGLIIHNTTTGQQEWNAGTDVARNWQPFGANGAGISTVPPPDGSITAVKLAAAAVIPAKMDFTQAFDFSAAGGLKAQGMRVMRHPYAGDYHLERGFLTGTESGSGYSGSVSFTDAFAGTPAVLIAPNGNLGTWSAIPGTSGFSYGGGGSGGTHDASWIAMGSD